MPASGLPKKGGSEPERTHIGNVSKPVHGFHRDTGGNEGRPTVPPVFLSHDYFQPFSVDNVRESPGLHGVQGWNFLYPAFQLANLGYPRHDTPICRTLPVDENELATMDTEFIRRGRGIVRRNIVGSVRIEFEQGGHLAFRSRFRDIGEL